MNPLDLNGLIRFDEERVRTHLVLQGKHMRVALFCLARGQTVPLHTSPSEVLMQVVRGRGSFQVGETRHPVESGSVVLCAANEPHGMTAQEEMVVLAVIAPVPI